MWTLFSAGMEWEHSLLCAGMECGHFILCCMEWGHSLLCALFSFLKKWACNKQMEVEGGFQVRHSGGYVCALSIHITSVMLRSRYTNGTLWWHCLYGL